MPSYLFGLLCLFLFAVSQGVRDALFGNFFQSFSFMFIAALAFSCSCVLFIAITFLYRRGDFRRLAASPGVFALLNVTTALAWFGFFYGLRHLEPAVVATLYNGAGPLAALALGGLGLVAAPARFSGWERLCYTGIAGSLAALALVVITGRSGLSSNEGAPLAAAIAFTVFGGVMIATSYAFARRFNDAGVASHAVMGTQFLLTLLVAVAWEAFLGDAGARPSAQALPLIALAAFALIVVPTFLVQLGVSRTSALAVNVFRALGPVFVFAVQQVDGRLHFSGATLICITAFCAFAVAAGMLRTWNESRAELAQ